MVIHVNADLEMRYQRFLEQVSISRQVWLLVGPDLRGAWAESNHYQREDGEPIPVHLVYSAAAYARQHATGDWAALEAVSLGLDDFIDGPLQGMHEQGDLVGPDFNADLAGVEVEPADLAHALRGDIEP